MAIETYGLEFESSGDELTDRITVESYCFRTGLTVEEGGLGKFQHFKNIVELLWNNPVMECHKRFIWNEWSEQMLREACNNKYLAVSGSASSGKSDTFALWALVNYIADPTHCKVLVMSTTIAGAKQRIWKTLLEYWQGIPNLPGKFLASNNLIKGVSYDGEGLTESSGIRLLASEKSKEKDALEKIIGIKAPKTDGEDGRIGTVILIIDEMTGCSESVYHAAKQNLASNKNFQLIGMSNFNNPFDAFGQMCKPVNGWMSVTEQDYEWEIENGKCIILDAELSPRLRGHEECVWMLSREQIDAIEKEYGRKSLAFYRMVKGRPSPKGAETSIYDPAEIIRTGSMGMAFWDTEPPTPCAFLDASFSGEGDPALATFGLLGRSIQGVQTLQITEQVALKVDITKKNIPVSYQLKDAYRKACEERKIHPKHIGYDSTGAGGPFGQILNVEWSRDILGVHNGGAASSRPVVGLKNQVASDVYANKCTETWYNAKSFFRSGQIRGITDDLAKEICSRQSAKNQKGESGRKLMVESKRVFKQREGKSPDRSDSFLGLIELCRTRMGFKTTEKAIETQEQRQAAPVRSNYVEYAITTHLAKTSKRPLITVKRLVRG